MLTKILCVQWVGPGGGVSSVLYTVGVTLLCRKSTSEAQGGRGCDLLRSVELEVGVYSRCASLGDRERG